MLGGGRERFKETERERYRVIEKERERERARERERERARERNLKERNSSLLAGDEHRLGKM